MKLYFKSAANLFDTRDFDNMPCEVIDIVNDVWRVEFPDGRWLYAFADELYIRED